MQQIKQRMGNYRLLQILGKGSFADVYLGKHIYLKHEVAVKVLYGRMDEEIIGHFLEEASHLRDLEHPHIVRILDVGIEDDIPYLVMEYAPGGTLRDRHRRGERLPLATVVSYVQQIASALDYAHQQKLVHRDLKPENLLLGSDDRILLSDFGVALPLHHTDSMSVQTVGGTLAYMAPEQIRGKPRAASDQYALAILVYEWLSGRRPFTGNATELLGQHLFVTPTALTQYVPDLFPSVGQVINKALAKDYTARFAHVSDFAELLERASNGEEISLPSSFSISEEESSTERLQLLAPAKKTFYNLPARVSTLIGRDTELKAASVLLSRPEVRLLTLTGPGGIGKTTLAIACVSDILTAFRHGSCYVSLASISDPDQVIPALIQTLGIQEQRDLPLIASLKQVLHDKHLLIVIDNFEQVLDAAPLLLELLQSCPELKMLVTSRAILHVPGEQTLPVPPLQIPDIKQTDETALLANPSIALFVERAQALKPDFQITSANKGALVKLCRQLDGLPLAIELAAARINHLTPQQLLNRLSRKLDLLSQQGSAVPVRQQTIRKTIQWSYDLLTEPEQLLLARLSVFIGGCAVTDVEALYERLQDDPFWVIDGLASLIDKSLIFQREPEDGEARLNQLEVIREFAKEKIEEKGLLEKTREAYAQHYAALVPVPEPSQLALAQGTFLAQLKRDYQNLLSALHIFMEKGALKQALELVVGLGGIWFLNGYGSEGQEEMERLLSQVQPEQTPISSTLYAMAVTLVGRICLNNNDPGRASMWYRRSLALSRNLPDKRFLGMTFAGLVFAEGELGNYAEVEVLCNEIYPLLRQLGDQGVLVRMLNSSCMIWLRQGKIDRALAEAQEGVQIARVINGQEWTLASMLHVLAWIEYLQGSWSSAHAYDQESVSHFRKLSFPVFGLETLSSLAHDTLALGDQATAQALFEEHLTLAQEAGDNSEIGRSYCGLGYLALAREDWAEARRMFEDSLRTLHQITQLSTRYTYLQASSLEGLATIFLSSEQPFKAVWLLGAAETVRYKYSSFDPRGREAPFYEDSREKAREILGQALYNRTLAEGKRMTILQALASQESSHHTSLQDQKTPKGDDPAALQDEGRLPSGEYLTRREIDVLRLLTQGMSNAEIAEKLVLSVVTVNSYLRSIYSKLGVSSRTRATRYALDHRLIT